MAKGTSTSTAIFDTRAQQHLRGGKRILYLTFDGLLEPLGQSQVLSYICRLSERGFSYVLLSLEREHDLVDAEAVAETEEILRRYRVKGGGRLSRRAGGAGAAS